MFPTIKGKILLKNKKYFYFFFNVDFLIMELYNMELFSDQLFTAKFVRNEDSYTFLNVEWPSRYT